jgi:hypothetical protein
MVLKSVSPDDNHFLSAFSDALSGKFDDAMKESMENLGRKPAPEIDLHLFLFSSLTSVITIGLTLGVILRRAANCINRGRRQPVVLL